MLYASTVLLREYLDGQTLRPVPCPAVLDCARLPDRGMRLSRT